MGNLNTYHKAEKTWGGEIWVENNELYCSKLLLCTGNWSSQGKYHYHKNKDETFFILDGILLLDIDKNESILTEGESYRIKPNTKHRFKSFTESCLVLETSTHHEDSDTYYA